MSQEQEQQDKQHQAAVIKGLWDALTTPKWDKDTLIEMGKLIYMRTSLKDMPQAKFKVLFPKLVEVAGALLAHFEITPCQSEEPSPEAPAAEDPK